MTSSRIKSPLGAPSFIELGAPAGDPARLFFGALFEWPTKDRGNDNFLAETPGVPLGIHPQDETRAMVVYFAVADLDVAIARVRELGGRASEPSADPDFGRFVECRDPQGVRFGLHQQP